MPDDVKNALMARELKGKTDSETERLRRKYVRDMLDARAADRGEVRDGASSRDINLPANLSERELKTRELTRDIGNSITSSRVKRAQAREDYNQEYMDRADAGLRPEPPNRQDINLPVERTRQRIGKALEGGTMRKEDEAKYQRDLEEVRYENDRAEREEKMRRRVSMFGR